MGTEDALEIGTAYAGDQAEDDTNLVRASAGEVSGS